MFLIHLYSPFPAGNYLVASIIVFKQLVHNYNRIKQQISNDKQKRAQRIYSSDMLRQAQIK